MLDGSLWNFAVGWIFSYSNEVLISFFSLLLELYLSIEGIGDCAWQDSHETKDSEGTAHTLKKSNFRIKCEAEWDELNLVNFLQIIQTFKGKSNTWSQKRVL